MCASLFTEWDYHPGLLHHPGYPCRACLDQAGYAYSTHMLIFYYGVFAGLTPPVGIAFMTAAGIAGAKQLETGLAAVKIAFLGLLAPIIWTYKPGIILNGPIPSILWAFFTVAVGMTAITMGFIGYSINKNVPLLLRGLFVALGLGIIFFSFSYQLVLIFAYGVIF
jgi:TRAP-type uncharacterized transport system fused permease subunit